MEYRVGPEIAPAEPITKPAPVVVPRPDENDPWNVPAPLINPTPKGSFFFTERLTYTFILENSS